MPVEQLKTVLTTLGLTAEQIKEVEELPADKIAEWKPDALVTGITTGLEAKVKNDPKFYETLDEANIPKPFLDKLHASQYGRAATEVRQTMLKAMGFKDDDFKHLGDEGKKIAVFVKEFAKKVSEGKVSETELQAQLIETRQKLEAIETGAPEKEKALKDTLTAGFNEEKYDLIIENTIAAHANDKGVYDLKMPPAYIVDKVAAELKRQYGFELTGKTSAELRAKENPKLKVLNGTKELTLKDAINTILKRDGLITDPVKGPQEGQVEVKVNGTSGGLVIGDSIKKRLEEDARQA